MTIADVADAGKIKFARDKALTLARSMDKVIAARGRKTIVFDMVAAPPTDAELLAAILGPTGNLRAPTIRRGRTLLVGFNEGIYKALLLK